MCEECGRPLKSSRRRNARFCDRSCTNKAYWRKNKAERLVAHAEWRARTSADRSAKNAERLAQMTCAECGSPIVGAQRSTRRFCSRYCVNQQSLRVRKLERREATRRRQKRVKANGGPGVSVKDWERLCRRHQMRCAYCQSASPLTMDHVVPLARGGWHAIGNILPACQPCNSSKRDDFLAHWRHAIPKARLRSA